jgi:cell division protein FtsX
LILANAAGKDEAYTVRAVLATPPRNSSFQFDLLTSLEFALTTGQLGANDWRNPTLVTTFVQLEGAGAVAAVTRGLRAYVSPHNGARTDWPVAGFYPQPFAEVATTSDRDFANFVHGSPLEANPRGVAVIVPAVMSLFILLITCFNFTNISVAFAGNRLKEIGIRKVLGGVRMQLVGQFMTENLILSFAAAVLAFGFVQALLPVLNPLMSLQLAVDPAQPALWLFLVGLPVLTAVVAGLYPAVYLSGFKPIAVLKGKTTLGSGSRFTRVLLTAQLGLSCLALVVGLVMTRNAYYQREADFGYDLEGVTVVEVDSPRTYTALSQAVAQHPQVRAVGGAAQHLAESSYPGTLKGEAGELKAQVAHVGGEAYLNTMGVRLLRGRHFHDGPADREASVLVNQTLADALHLKEPVGRQIQLDGKSLTIVGVVNDYKEFGLHGLVPPCVLRPAAPDEFKYLVVNARPEHLAGVNRHLQAAWRKVAPGVPYQGFLQSELVAKERYLNEGLKGVAFFMAVVTLLLSASGLFALVSLDILRRRKEIGLRKILGASVWQVVSLLNRSFARILLAGFAVGSLLAYLLIDKLIFRFIYVYHPPLGAGAFAATLAIVVGACCATIGWKVYRSATANPAGALRHD